MAIDTRCHFHKRETEVEKRTVSTADADDRAPRETQMPVGVPDAGYALTLFERSLPYRKRHDVLKDISYPQDIQIFHGLIAHGALDQSLGGDSLPAAAFVRLARNLYPCPAVRPYPQHARYMRHGNDLMMAREEPSAATLRIAVGRGDSYHRFHEDAWIDALASACSCASADDIEDE